MEFTLTHDETIVLFEFLTRLEQNEVLTIEHPAEEAILSKIQGQMESTLAEPFHENWKEILKSARNTVSLANGLDAQ